MEEANTITPELIEQIMNSNSVQKPITITKSLEDRGTPTKRATTTNYRNNKCSNNHPTAVIGSKNLQDLSTNNGVYWKPSLCVHDAPTSHRTCTVKVSDLQQDTVSEPGILHESENH
ncbi:hypothetical protein Tco_0175400 [Tanacetum coccineum]